MPMMKHTLTRTAGAALGVALLAAALPGAVAAQTMPTRPKAPATLTVTGDGLVSKAPDRATVTAQIVTDDPAAAASTGKNNAIDAALLARLTALGIARPAIRTTFFSVNFVPFPPKNLPPEQRRDRYGYVTTRGLAIDVASLENVGKVVDAANAAGVTSIGDVTFSLGDRRGAYSEALGKAMNDARASADAVARAGGVRLVRILTVTTGDEPIAPRPLPMARTFAAADASAPPTVIEPSGPIDVTAHVTIVYEIE
jgi:uncharacterized protein YggE